MPEPLLPVLADTGAITYGTLAVVAFLALVVLRFVAKAVLRLVLLALLVLVGIGAWVERDELATCADTCACAPLDREVTVPFCRDDLDELDLPAVPGASAPGRRPGGAGDRTRARASPEPSPWPPAGAQASARATAMRT